MCSGSELVAVHARCVAAGCIRNHAVGCRWSGGSHQLRFSLAISRCSWQEDGLALVTIATSRVVRCIRSQVTRCSPIDVVRPVLDLSCPLHPLLVAFALEVAQSPAEEPAKNHRHTELDHDSAENEGQRDVQHDVRSNTADRDRIDESDLYDIGHAIRVAVQTRALDVCSDVLASECLIASLDSVEEGRIRHLGCVQPVEKVHIDDNTERDQYISGTLAGTHDL